MLRSFRSYRDFDLYTLQRSPAAWHQFVCWRTWAQQQAANPQTRIKRGSVLRVQCNGFLRNYRPWRSPFPNPRPPQETLDIVARYPRPRDAAVDEAIARASQIDNHLTFEIIDVKRAGLDYFSQVFFGKLEGTDTAICVKLFDERLFPCSQQPEYGEGVEPELHLFDLNFADDMMRREEGVYCDRLQYLQGSMIPHCYGFHVLTLPDGWEVLGFFMEVIDGPSLWEVGQQNRSPDFQASVVTSVRHLVRALGFAGVDQRDWHLDQILCPRNFPVTVPPHGDDDDACVQSHSAIPSHLPMVLIDFAFAPQKLGEDWSRPGYPIHNPSVVKLTLYDEIRVPYDVINDHWLPMMEEEY
ncbi:hypothetical protein HETIRDRAFT_429516 [Heterobasidion irregulare TC 32-1]|uniref:Protein kinase domain-containing protein n=1 Tax=Heterobasidion irregulare (strain TC 32-1) TaxID=747525 RepID=W4JUI3_HETIT|nr:uncharacterized protein HETIRDRAFT_429516 [Heterobasidion irregulare TC 32-1]ETW77207.1 hypothetical protein HETIRDRAFT_429516 [Heterobasidion irregulare TC 32-1]